MNTCRSRDSLALQTVNLDNPDEVNTFVEQVMTEGMRRVQAEGAELRANGVVDAEGNLLVTELPPDMRGGSDRDFGG